MAYDIKSEPGYQPGDEFRPSRDLEERYAKAREQAASGKATITTYANNPSKNLWEQSTPTVKKGVREADPTMISSYFSDPTPKGLEGFDYGAQAGKNVVSQVYGSQDAKNIWSRLQDESQQGLNAMSMKSIKDKYGSQGVMEQAKIQKAGLKGQAALRASEDLESQKRQEMAAMDQAIKKESFNTMRDEWGRRTLLATNLPIAYGQLGSAASLGQVLQNLAGTKINA